MSQIEATASKVDLTGERQSDLRRLELRVVEHSLKNLMTFPYIRQRVGARRIAVARRLFRRGHGPAVRPPRSEVREIHAVRRRPGDDAA